MPPKHRQSPKRAVVLRSSLPSEHARSGVSATATVFITVAVAGRDLFNRHGSFNVSPVEWPSHDGVNWWRENALGKLLYRLALFFGFLRNVGGKRSSKAIL